VSILPWASADDGVPATYDSTYGLRPLNSNELTALTSGLSVGTGSAGQNAKIATVTLSGNTTVNSLSDGSGTIGLDGTNTLTVSSGFIDPNNTTTIGSSVNDGTLALGAEGIILVENTLGETINSVISGTSGLTVDFNDVSTNTASLTLAGANTFTGTTTLMGNRFNDMHVILDNSLALQDTTLNYNEYGSKITFGSGGTTGTNAYTFGAIEGAQNLTLANGNSTAQAVALTVGGDGASTTYSGVFSDGSTAGGSLIKTGTGTFTLTGLNTYTGGTIIQNGTLGYGVANALLSSGTVAFTGGALLYGSGVTTDISAELQNSTGAITIYPNNQSITFASSINSTNTGGLTLAGPGTLTLSASNSYTGGTMINSGTLVAQGNNLNGITYVLGGTNNAVTIGNSATGAPAGLTDLNFNTFPQPVTVASGSGPYTFTANGSNNSGQATITTGLFTLTGTDTLNIVLTNASPYRPYGGISGTGNIIVNTQGSGNLFMENASINNVGTVTNASTGTGGISQGNSTGVFGANVTSLIQNSATAPFNLHESNSSFVGTAQVLSGSMQLTAATALDSANQVSVASGATLDVQVGNTIAGLVNVSGSGGTVLNSTTTPDTLTLGGTGTYSYSGVILDGGTAGGMTLIKSNSGTQTLSGSNSYTGGTTVSGGILQLGNGSAMGTALASVSAGATLDLDGQTINNALSITGTGVGGNGALINSSTSAQAEVLGNIAGINFTVGGRGT
jgi:fibronectin-binding autotransporter adhesin